MGRILRYYSNGFPIEELQLSNFIYIKLIHAIRLSAVPKVALSVFFNRD